MPTPEPPAPTPSATTCVSETPITRAFDAAALEAALEAAYMAGYEYARCPISIRRYHRTEDRANVYAYVHADRLVNGVPAAPWEDRR